MRRTAVAIALVGALSALAGTVATAAHADYAPASAPYNLSGNNTGLTTILNDPTLTPTGADPVVPGATLTDGAQVLTRARMIARVLPGLEVLSSVALGVGAFEIGWKIGTATYLHFIAPGAPAGSATNWGFVWSTVLASTYCPGAATACFLLSGQTAHFSTRTRFEPVGTSFNGDTSPSYVRTEIDGLRDSAAAVGVAPMTAQNGRTVASEYGTGSTNTAVVVTYPKTSDGLAAYLGVAPTTATAYNALPSGQKLTSSYTPPTLTTTDLANARGIVGAPVAGKNVSGQYVDGTGSVLTPGQVEAQVDLNCRLDSSYCAGGANDPSAPGAPLATVFVMPNCVGISQTACGLLLDAGGQTGARTYTTLPATTAQLDKPAGAIVDANYSAGVSLSLGTALLFHRNPDVMPMVLPQPLHAETYAAYVARLRTLGWLGTAVLNTVPDTDADTTLGPDALLRTHVTTVDTLTRTLGAGVPADYPSTAPPRIAVDAPITFDANSSDIPPVGAGGGGSCTCPPIDLSPLSAAHPSTKFPFGVFAYFSTVLGWLNVSPEAPSFDIHISAAIGGHSMPNYAGNLSFLDSYMAIVRTLMSFALWVGAIWFVATRMLGFGAGGDVTEAADDGGVF
jgi:hypothetical protein